MRSARKIVAGADLFIRLGALVSFASVAGAIVGCADVSFKPGASPGAMQQDEQDCRASTEGEDAFVACMKDRGYLLARSGVPVTWAPASR